MTQQTSPTIAGSRDELAPKRPKGILKNSNSYQLNSTPTDSTSAAQNNAHATSPLGNDMEAVSPTSGEGASVSNHNSSGSATSSATRPVHPGIEREISEKELTLANTLANMGPRRNSSNTRSSISGSASRRQSSGAMDIDADDNDGPRLKWDEANLYLAEQERGATMKIDEPKTPWAKQYDPGEDEEELAVLNAQELVVDELDRAKPTGAGATSEANHGHGASNNSSTRPAAHARREQIPDLDLGEPEEPVNAHMHLGDGEKRVLVDESSMDASTPGGHGEDPEESMTVEQLQKHRQFEERRKKHYEMHNIKDMLSHPEENLDEMDDDEAIPRP